MVLELYMVIYMAGHVAGTIGPLPYDMEECKHRAEELWAKGHADRVTPDGFTMKDVKFVCEKHTIRPKNDDES